jgi:hypothetical protein
MFVMKSSKWIKILCLFVLCVSTPIALFAHPGHGQEGTALHDLVHAAWITAIVAIIALPLLRWWKAGPNRDDG